MATKRIGYADRTQVVAMVNPRGGPVAETKAKGKGHGGQKSTTKKKPRKKNPTLTGVPLAFGAGIGTRVIDGFARFGADALTEKNLSWRGPARLLAALAPAAGSLLVEDSMPQVAHGMAGASGAAFAEELIMMVSSSKDGKPPASWAKYLGVGGRLDLAAGGFLYVDDKGVGQYQAPIATGQKDAPAPVPVKLASAVPIRTNFGTREIVAPLDGGGVLIRNPRTNTFSTLTGNGITFNGLVRTARLNGLVKMSTS